MDAEPGRWVEEPILPELDPDNPHAPPPAELIDVHGAQPVRVYTIDHPDPRRRRGFTQALILAWAPRLDGSWGVLIAWLSGWQQGGRTSGGGRWAWCRLTREDVRRGRVRPVKPHVRLDDEWYGMPADSDFGQAVAQAVGSLPRGLREAAGRASERGLPGGTGG